MLFSVSRVSQYASTRTHERISTRGNELNGTWIRAHEHTSTKVHQHMSTGAHKNESTLSFSKSMIAREDESHVGWFLRECMCLFPKKNARLVLFQLGRRWTISFMFVFAFHFNVLLYMLFTLHYINIRTLRKTRRERHQIKGLISKKNGRARYNSWYISLPSSAKQQREMTRFYLFWRTWTTIADFSYFYLKLNQEPKERIRNTVNRGKF